MTAACRPRSIPLARAGRAAGLAVTILLTATRLAAQPPGPAQAAPAPGAALRALLDVSLESAAAAQAGFDGTHAYVPLRDGRLVSVDLSTGAVRWTLDIRTSLAPVAAGGRVFVAGPDQLVAVTADGRVAWRRPLPAGAAAPLVAHADSLLVPAAGEEIWRVRIADGRVVWRQRLVAPIVAPPVAMGARLYLALQDARVAALEIETGTPVWSTPLGGVPGAMLVTEDRLFVGATDRFLYAISLKDGDRAWRFRAGATAVGTPAADERHVYFTGLDNVLRAHHRRNGTLKWKQGLPLRPSGGPLLIGDTVLVTGISAEVRGYRARDGEPVGAFEAPRDLAAPPQLLPDPVPMLTRLVLLTRTGELQVLGRDVEPALEPLSYPFGTPVTDSIPEF